MLPARRKNRIEEIPFQIGFIKEMKTVVGN